MSENTNTPLPYGPGDMPFKLRLSYWLRNVVDFIGKSASWLIVPLVIITVIDVVGRKLIWRDPVTNEVYGMQIWLINNISPFFGSTLLQELQWHLHTGLFALVLGFGYIYNTHVRVDLVRETLPFRRKAWIEFIGITIFLLPYCLITTYFALVYAFDSWQISEISNSQVGLTNRWIIKSVLAIGFVFAALAGLAVWLQMVLVLFGERGRRFELLALEWPEEAGMTIEGKRRIEIKEDEPLFKPGTIDLEELEVPGARGTRQQPAE